MLSPSHKCHHPITILCFAEMFRVLLCHLELLLAAAKAFLQLTPLRGVHNVHAS